MLLCTAQDSDLAHTVMSDHLKEQGVPGPLLAQFTENLQDMQLMGTHTMQVALGVQAYVGANGLIAFCHRPCMRHLSLVPAM